MQRLPADQPSGDPQPLSQMAGSGIGTTPSEREETMWCEIVKLQYRIKHLEQSVTLRDEMIALLKEKITGVMPVVRKETLSQMQKGLHPCENLGCEMLCVRGKRHCSRSCAVKHRWAAQREARREIILPNQGGQP